MDIKELYGNLDPISSESGISVHQLLTMLRSLMPVLDEMKQSVEKTSSKIPKASQQLTNVTEATESATMEILNFLDEISQRIGRVETRLKDIENDLGKKELCVQKLVQALNNLTEEQRKPLLPFEKEWRNLIDLSLHVTTIGELRTHLSEVQNISMNIAMALQVQDITSQQIESVRHLIESVRTQLSNVVDKYEGKEFTETLTEDPVRSFDEHARYNKDTSRQEEADSIIAQFTKHNSSNGVNH